ncbi:MAG: topoisomerase [Candidatus Saccharibacteria bacterium]|nr:topoisomerase [Candidatus Saccharibacteria bacterium]
MSITKIHTKFIKRLYADADLRIICAACKLDVPISMSAKNLVIVESPAKAKTIQKYLGKDFEVKSSFGHIRDLPKKGLNIDVAKDFEPTYAVSTDKKKIVAELRKAAAGAEVWLASDEDREGEAIAWHLCQALKLDPKKTKRIVFHEITKPAIEHAVKNPRTVDQNLVDAQQARRILDRLVGYELSPVLWKKVRPGLSAGRVQSVAVRLIAEREREIREFQASSSFRVTGVFLTGETELPAELLKRFDTPKDTRSFLDKAKDATFSVEGIDQKPGSRNPGAPFTTSSLQQEAARRLGFSVKQTMTLAQRLYESGLITYMRTDSTILSGTAIKAAEDYILSNFGENYHNRRQFKTKNDSAQEAHEAIRPTDFNKTSAGADPQQKKLYELIWRRVLASQMSGAEVSRTEVTIGISTTSEKFLAKGEVLKFDGYLKVYGGGKDDVILPSIEKGQTLERRSIAAAQTFSRPAARYSEAALVKKLEELGIGRPSTYAPTISTIQTRGYVERGDLEGQNREAIKFLLEADEITETVDTEVYGADRNKLLPTHLAEITTDFLTKHFPTIVDYAFTARVEEEFDTIAEGKEQWAQMLKGFYKDFHPLVTKSEGISREESTQTRQIGVDPTSNKPIMSRYGRFGPMLQRGETESEEKPEFAPLPANTTIDTVTLEQALEMFKLPRTLGETEDGKPIKANIGRFGPYVQVGTVFVSIKPHDPHTITLEEALALYAEKLEKDAKKNIQEFKGGLKVIMGPYGPFVTNGKKNAKIPKDTDPAKLTEDEAKALIEAAPDKKKRPFRKKASK